MRAFWHFNEASGANGDMLTPLMLFSSQLTLWAPSKSIVQEAYRNDLCPFDACAFLELLRNGCFRIAAREDWIVNGDQRRKSNWVGATFHKEFDGEILKIFADDHGKKDARVFTAPDERGYAIADEQIEANGIQYQTALSHVRDRKIPKGTLERTSRLVGCQSANWTSEMEKRAARELLRDSVNHEDARLYTCSDVSVESDPKTTAVFGDIADRKSMDEEYEDESKQIEFSMDSLLQAIDIAKRLSGAETVDGVIEIKKDCREQKFLWDFLHAERLHLKKLTREIHHGKDFSPLYESVLGKKIEDRIKSICGVILFGSALYFQRKRPIDRRRALLALASIGLASMPIAGEVAERNSLVPERDFGGPKWPFVLRFGKSDPTREMIEEMLEFLDGMT